MNLTLEIEKNVYGGDGLARLRDGRVVFVEGSFAGETVTVELITEKRHFVRARLVDILKRHPGRLAEEPRPIPGMVYAPIDFSTECALKRAQLEEFLSRARIEHPIIPEIPQIGTMLNYRNKVIHHFDAKNPGCIGYRMEPSHTILDMPNDPLACPEINAALPSIRAHVKGLLTNSPKAVQRELAKDGRVTIRYSSLTGLTWWVGKAPSDQVLREKTCKVSFQVPADGFYQVNPAVGEELVKTVKAHYEKLRAEVPHILDLYCGVGVFGLCCHPEKLTGIESGRAAIEAAKRNAVTAGQLTAKFRVGQVGRVLRHLEIDEKTAVIIDPPRGGLEPGVAEALLQKAPRVIFSISCDPATLTRDLKILTKGYQITHIQAFNMFPRTASFETLVILTKSN